MLKDFRYAFRSLGKAPALVLTVILCLGLGVGANTTIFSLTNAVFLRPLPVHEPDRLVRVYSGWNQQDFRLSSYPEFEALRSRKDVFKGLATYRPTRVSVGQEDGATMEQAMTVTGDYFMVMGIQPAHGRFFTAAEDHVGAQPVLVLTHHFWQARLAGDPSAIGRVLHINGRPYTVIGVAPEDFHGNAPDQEVAAWLPFGSYARNGEQLTQNWHGLEMVGRLQKGVNIGHAGAAASGVGRQLGASYGGEWKDLDFTILPGHTLVSPKTNAEVHTVFILLNSVVALVLLIACANIANILLARGMSRRREIAIRLSLGAGRLRLIRQLLAESVLLGLAGGMAGLLLAFWGADLLSVFKLPAAIDPTPDRRVFLYALCVALATGIIFGLLPALHATRVPMAESLKHSVRQGAPVKSWLRSTLVISQLAISVLLLSMAGLFLRVIVELRSAQTGIDARGMLAAELDLRTLNLSEEAGRLLADRIQARIANLPGVEAATLSSTVPSGGRHWNSGVTLPEHESYRTQEVSISYNTIGSDYLNTLGVPLERGRTLTRADGAGQPPVTVVNEAFVKRFFPEANPLGQHIRMDTTLWQIVGVMRDVRYESAGYEAEPTMLISYHQRFEPNLTLQLRARGAPSALIPVIRRELKDLHAGLAANFRTFAEIRNEAEFAPRLVSTLLSVFGAVALLLASLGLYGVIAYVVAQRTHEIGVRMALGARPQGVLRLVARQGLRFALTGGTIGTILALGAGRLLSSQLYGVSPFDPVIFGTVVLLLGSIALLASLIPALRAARVDPVIALRADG
jgi:putative ABC transport system permease protein